MTTSHAKSSRRAFVLSGGAALGAGVAAPASAASLPPQANHTGDIEAIRQVHLAYTSLMESRHYEAVTALFDEQAQLQLSGEQAAGRDAIGTLLAGAYREQTAAAIHDAYRPNAQQRHDAVTVAADRRRATATWHVDVLVSVPLQADCTAAQMARLQGQSAQRRWERGALQAAYVRRAGTWKLESIWYRAA
jgi:SnoaL-like domain